MADGNITPAVAAVFVPEIWRSGFLKGLYDQSFMRKRVLNADGDVANMGDILHIRIQPQMTVQTPTAGTGVVTAEALTPTEAQLTVDKHRAVAFSVLDITKAQADNYLQPCLEGGGPLALAEDIDTYLLALWASFSKTAVDATEGITSDKLLEAFVSLGESKVMAGDMQSQLMKMNWAFAWKQYPALKKSAQIGEYGITGKAGGILEYKIPDILGIPVHFSNLIAEDSSEDKNILFHEEAFACGVQQNIKPEKLARVALRDDYVTSVMFGVKAVRTATHAIVIRTDAA
jgi:hypothetical protein